MDEVDEVVEPSEQAAGVSLPGRAETAVADRRLIRGARARRTIARRAVDVASLEGLNGLSFGRLAADLGISKSGIQTLFGSKKDLQLAAITAAGDAFHAAVVRPASDTPRGAPRLRALVRHWITYAETPLFAGGCFWAANLADFDSRPGPVHDALFGHHRIWLATIAAELRHAATTGQIQDLDADLAAFQIDAVLLAANTALRLGDDSAVGKVHRVVGAILASRR